MTKKLFLLVAACIMTLSASAQFQKGKGYIGGSLTGLNLHYNGNDKFSLGLQAQGGYFIADNLMLLGEASFEHSSNDAVADRYTLGVGGRYYLESCGLFFGAAAKLVHCDHNHNDVMPGLEVGYAFFLNRSVTIEPALYYDQSFTSHSKYSTIGLRVGVGIYLFDD